MPYPLYWSKFNRGNAYHSSYQMQVRQFNSGMPGLWIQDAACQSGVMPVYDRTKEHLGSTDLGVARTRRFLLDALRKLASDGQRPAPVSAPSSFMWRAISITVDAGADWEQVRGEFMRAKLGADFGYTP